MDNTERVYWFGQLARMGFVTPARFPMISDQVFGKVTHLFLEGYEQAHFINRMQQFGISSHKLSEFIEGVDHFLSMNMKFMSSDDRRLPLEDYKKLVTYIKHAVNQHGRGILVGAKSPYGLQDKLMNILFSVKQTDVQCDESVTGYLPMVCATLSVSALAVLAEVHVMAEHIKMKLASINAGGFSPFEARRALLEDMDKSKWDVLVNDLPDGELERLYKRVKKLQQGVAR